TPMKAPIWVSVLLGVIVVGCSSTPEGELSQLRKAGSFDLYSLEPFSDLDSHELDENPNGPGERLHGWRNLGKTTVKDEATRDELLDELKKGLQQPGRSAKCFQPRHAIRRMANGKPVDLL